MQRLTTLPMHASRGVAVVPTDPTPFPLLFVYTIWVLFLMEPEWWLASFGAEPLKRIPTLLLPIAVGLIWARPGRPALYWPMALFVVSHAMTLPFVPNRGYAMDALKYVFFFYVFLVVSAATIDTVREALPILGIYLVQFAWWSIHGLRSGRVGWHSTMSNEDGFGPVMVMGMAFASFFALGARSRSTRAGAILVAALCTVGIVASSARGAAIAAALVVVVLWLRSHRKRVMFVGALLVVGTMLVASYMLFPGGEYWAELMTISEDIQAIGADPDGPCVRPASKRACGSGTDRWDLWGAGWEVFLRSPFVGAGPGNFGAYAAEHFRFGEASGFYEDPAHLYGRSLHNIYVQVLSEQGVIGAIIFLLILFDFVRRNRALRTESRIVLWDKATEGRSDLRSISLALEGAMVGYLASGAFYDQLYTSSLYALVALNFVLYSVTHRHGAALEAPPAATEAPGVSQRRARA